MYFYHKPNLNTLHEPIEVLIPRSFQGLWSFYQPTVVLGGILVNRKSMQVFLCRKCRMFGVVREGGCSSTVGASLVCSLFYSATCSGGLYCFKVGDQGFSGSSGGSNSGAGEREVCGGEGRG